MSRVQCIHKKIDCWKNAYIVVCLRIWVWHNVEVWHLNWYSFFRSNYGVQILSIPKTRLIKKSKIGEKKKTLKRYDLITSMHLNEFNIPSLKNDLIFFIFGGSNGANSHIGQKAFKNLTIIASQRRFKRHLLTPVT